MVLNLSMTKMTIMTITLQENHEIEINFSDKK